MKAENQANDASIFSLLKQAILGTELNFTEGSIRRAIFLLSVPMIIEMGMESVFAIVDIYFVSRLNDINAVTVVGLTELSLTAIYSIAMGLATGATALVARRVGEKDEKGAGIAGIQAIYIGLFFAASFTVVGFIWSGNLLRLLGAEEAVIETGVGYMRWMWCGNLTIMMLFLINGIFRGAGNAAIAMKALVLANILNIILDPMFIFGFGPIPAMGVEGAAIATNIGRGIGVLLQLYVLLGGTSVIKITARNTAVKWNIIGTILRISAGATGQFLISSASWVFLGTIIARFGTAAVAGYTFGVRVIVFTILPSFGMANAAATLVGQNLGAGQPDRAEASVWKAGLYNLIFLGGVTVLFLFCSEAIISIFTKDAEVIAYGTECLQVVALGYVFYGYGMVVNQSFNGAGDTVTPTVIALFGFWVFQIPFAYLLAIVLDFKTTGVYAAIAVAESLMAVVGILIFRKGKWKTVKI
ncbi:MAG TPA: MATE family efflux transporter [Cyclobacteriaceae bacterium]|nr:MATE family efflux transporter [Cyclobacteriaceae bacterium]